MSELLLLLLIVAALPLIAVGALLLAAFAGVVRAIEWVLQRKARDSNPEGGSPPTTLAT